MQAFAQIVRDFFWGQQWRSRGLIAVLIGVVCVVGYYGLARAIGHSDTPGDAYFNLQADAFLHGRLHLVDPPRTEDLTYYQGQWYLGYLPTPALLMMPWAALTGLGGVKTVFFNAVFAAANASLVFLMLDAMSRQRLSKLTLRDNILLTLLFAFGSVHWAVAMSGSVWQVSQICTVTFLALAAWLTVERAPPIWIGIALALAMGCRPHIIFAWPLLLGMTLTMRQLAPKITEIRWRKVISWSLLSALPVVVMGVCIMIYNANRFSGPFDFGYADMNVGQVFKADLENYGWFNLHYLPKNFWAMLLAGPEWVQELNAWRPNLLGMSLLLTTPALVYLACVTQRTWMVLGGVISIALILVPLLLYSSTGYGQFGYRYSLDFMIPVMALLALGAGQRVSWLMSALILIGVVVNLYGALWFFLQF